MIPRFPWQFCFFYLLLLRLRQKYERFTLSHERKGNPSRNSKERVTCFLFFFVTICPMPSRARRARGKKEKKERAEPGHCGWREGQCKSKCVCVCIVRLGAGNATSVGRSKWRSMVASGCAAQSQLQRKVRTNKKKKDVHRNRRACSFCFAFRQFSGSSRDQD